MAFKKGQSGNPAGKPVGIKHKRTLAVDAVREVFGSVDAFWHQVSVQAKEGDTIMAKELMSRLQPPYKASTQPLEIPLKLDGTLSETLNSILQAVANGTLPSDIAKDLSSTIGDINAAVRLETVEQKLDQLLEAQQ